MSPIKPTEREEEYFARQEYERLHKLAAEKAAATANEAAEQRKALHFMHCPKCGGDLTPISFKQIEIDKCTLCEGIWLDSGELQLVLQQEDATIMRRILKVFHNG